SFKAIVLGIIEGLTEFIPVSSTGHLLLIDHFFGFADEAFGKSFDVLIQFGAILALLSIYFVRLWKIAQALPSDPAARRFVVGVRRPSSRFILRCRRWQGLSPTISTRTGRTWAAAATVRSSRSASSRRSWPAGSW